MINYFKRQTLLVRQIITEHIKPGDSAIDATAGTGNDTLLLAEAVGNKGRVYAFDIQPEAIAQTRSRLSEKGVLNRVSLFQQGHETLDTIPEICKDTNIKAVMFNLGYLPGGDHRLTTQVESTIAAIRKALSLMADDGILTVCAYTHSEGLSEINALDAFCSEQKKGMDIYKVETLNHTGSPIAYIFHTSARKGNREADNEGTNQTK